MLSTTLASTAYNTYNKLIYVFYHYIVEHYMELYMWNASLMVYIHSKQQSLILLSIYHEMYKSSQQLIYRDIIILSSLLNYTYVGHSSPYN